MPRRPLYIAPFQLTGGVAAIPSGDFLLPICTNKDRLLAMSDALIQGGLENHMRLVDDHNIDFLQALSSINRPYRVACFNWQTFPILPTEPELPAGVNVDPDCIFIDTREYRGDVNILMEACVDIVEYCPPEEYKMQTLAEQQNNNASASAERLQQLADDIAQLLADQVANEAAIGQLEANIADVASLAQTNNSIANAAASSANQIRVDMIGSVRWFPGAAAIPAGWVRMIGQRILQGFGGTLDGITLYERVPAAWRDGDDIVLPNVPSAVPVGGNPDLFGNVGATGNFYGGSSSSTLIYRMPVVQGFWHIYIGEAVIA